MKRKLAFVLLVLLASLAWAGWAPTPSLVGGTGEQCLVDGRDALCLKTVQEEAKCFWWNEVVSAEPGSKWKIRVEVATDIPKALKARFGVFFLGGKGERLRGAGSNVLSPCGGSKEWKFYEKEFVVPENVRAFRPTVAIYVSAGTAKFANFTLTNDSGEERQLPFGKEEAPSGEKKSPDASFAAPRPSETIWSYKFKDADGVERRFHVTGVELDSELVHFDSPDSLKHLSGTISALGDAPAPYTADTSYGSAFWFLYNLSSLTQTVVFSKEKIDLSNGAKETRYALPFANRRTDYFQPLEKGPCMFRERERFQIFDRNGKWYATTNLLFANPQNSPEAAFFGTGRSGAGERIRKWTFTLANLDGLFAVKVKDFRSEGRPGGRFAFQAVVVDADGDEYPLNRLAKLSISGDGKPLAAEMHFEDWDIPSGWFVGSFGDSLPKALAIQFEVRAATPSGTKTVAVQDVYPTRSTAAKPPEWPAGAAAYCFKPGERRDVYIPLYIFWKMNEQEGRAAMKEMVRRLAEGHCTGIICFIVDAGFKVGDKMTTTYLQKCYDWDFFGELRKETKAAGLDLIGAIPVLREVARKGIDGIFAAHPDWEMRDVNGRRMGKPGSWLDPAVPEACSYRIQNILEAAKGYGLDGIDLDYARLNSYPSDRGAEIYQAKTGIDPRRLEYSSPEYRKWFKWESEQLTQMVREISQTLRKECPAVRLTAYVQGVRRVDDGGEYGTWLEDHQPYGDWLEEGLLDSIAPTGYIYDMLRYKVWVKRQIDYARSRNPKIPVQITIGTQSSHGKIQSLEELIYQVDEANRMGADGVHIFTWLSYQNFCEDMGKTRFAMPAK